MPLEDDLKKEKNIKIVFIGIIIMTGSWLLAQTWRDTISYFIKKNISHNLCLLSITDESKDECIKKHETIIVTYNFFITTALFVVIICFTHERTHFIHI